MQHYNSEVLVLHVLPWYKGVLVVVLYFVQRTCAIVRVQFQSLRPPLALPFSAFSLPHWRELTPVGSDSRDLYLRSRAAGVFIGGGLTGGARAAGQEPAVGFFFSCSCGRRKNEFFSCLQRAITQFRHYLFVKQCAARGLVCRHYTEKSILSV